MPDQCVGTRLQVTQNLECIHANAGRSRIVRSTGAAKYTAGLSAKVVDAWLDGRATIQAMSEFRLITHVGQQIQFKCMHRGGKRFSIYHAHRAQCTYEQG